MAYTPIADGDAATPALFNTRFAAIYSAVVDVATTAGDMIYATAASTYVRLAVGSARQLLQVNAAGTAPEWTSNVVLPGTLISTGLAVHGNATSLTVTSTASGSAALAALLQLHGVSGPNSLLGIHRWQNNSNSPTLVLAKSRGASAGTFAAVQNGDTIGTIGFAADDGTDITTWGAAITAAVNGTPAGSRMPADLQFKTAAGAGNDDLETKFAVLGAGGIAVRATDKFYLDGIAGTGNTYLVESSSDVVQAFAGGNMMLTYNATQMGFYGHALANRPTTVAANSAAIIAALESIGIFAP